MSGAYSQKYDCWADILFTPGEDSAIPRAAANMFLSFPATGFASSFPGEIEFWYHHMHLLGTESPVQVGT